MTVPEIEKELESLTLLLDTREHQNKKLDERLSVIGLPYVRQKLEFGDYSAKTNYFDLSNKVVIERKMNLDELALCFGSQRKRFQSEFERANSVGAKTYLLCENANMDVLLSDASYKIYCRSKLSRNAMLGSLMAWVTRYNIIPVFCASDKAGILIREILVREMKEYLNGLD